MKKNKVAIAVAFVSLPLALPSLSLLADDNVIVVTANRIEQDINNILTDIQTIERADIERIQPQSLVDLLVNIAGVDFTQSGGHGQDSSVFVRGTNSNQVLVLIDGIRVGSATLGYKAVSTIPVAQIERIEIVKGPRAAIWGSDAIGGVIQIFTRQYQSGDYHFAATVGSNSTTEFDGAVGFGTETFSNTLSYNTKKSDGFDARIDSETDDDGYQSKSIALRGHYQVVDNGILDWLLQSDDGDSDIDTSFGDNVNHFDNQIWNLRYSLQQQQWSHQVALNASSDKINDFKTQRQQFSYIARDQINERLSMTAGIEALQDDVSESVTVYANEKRTTKSAFVSVNFIGEQYLADLAVRNDDVEKVAGKTTYNVGLGWRINPQHLISANYAEGFKAPTFNDLYYPFGGNPNLDFETSNNSELVYKGHFEQGSVTLSLYDSSVDNLIQWTPDADGNWTPQNVGKAEISGIDINYRLSYGKFTHQISADMVDAKNAITHERLIRRAKNHFGYEMDYSDDAFEWFMQLQWVGKRPDLDYQTFTTTELPDFTRVNLGVTYAANSNWKFQLKVNDAFDEAPTLVSGYYPVAREIYFTATFQDLK